MVAIARAISFGARVLILDEPTSSLTETEVSVLFDVMRRLKSQGTAIVYISHRFEELYSVCDRVTVLRNGRNIVTRSLTTLNRLELVCHLLGRRPDEVSQGVTAFAGQLQNTPSQPVLLQAAALKYQHRLNGVSLQIRRGEIVGLAGLLGSGRSETARALFGAEPLEGGTVKLEGSLLFLRHPHDAIAAGIAFISEDRKADGIIPELSVRENLTLAALPNLTKWGIVSRKRQTELVNRFMQRLNIKAASTEQKIQELSGGNQQKVLLARWLCRNTKLLLLDEPTRGIDVGAKREIQSLIAELAKQGLGVLLISSELEELVEGSQRVVVLRDGRSIAELSGKQKNIQTILHVMAEGADQGKQSRKDHEKQEA
jgi:ribose transport system ATP-binding protein